jgi:hypothetical protein
MKNGGFQFICSFGFWLFLLGVRCATAPFLAETGQVLAA